jgi:hypothetical protein
MDERIAAAVRERAREGMLRCAEAFRVAGELGVSPLAVGRAADALDVRITSCQLGFFDQQGQKSVVEPAENVSSELEQAIREGLILGRLPCAVAWAIAARFGIPRLHVSNAAENLGIHIGQCQLGTF